LYLLDVGPEIIDLTIDEPAPSSSSVNTPEKTPKKRLRAIRTSWRSRALQYLVGRAPQDA
jgi:hypothetical protein